MYDLGKSGGRFRRAGDRVRNMCRGIDWQRAEIRDGAVIFGAALFIYGCAHFFDLPPQLFQFALDNTEWEVDDFIFVIFGSYKKSKPKTDYYRS